MSLGKKISKRRKDIGMTASSLAKAIGRSTAVMSDIENDRLKGGPAPDVVVAISEALLDESIMISYLEGNPVYQAVLPKVFPDLNSIRRDPAIIFSRIRNEMREGAEAADILSEIFGNSDPTKTPGYEKVFAAKLEQLIDVKRAIEILEFELLASKVMTKEFLSCVYDQQQKKCIDHGHHNPDVEEVE
ncbi:helix-turn-helix transcriptional regulator [Desulfuromonas acetoxidans]|uniref:helix-turn-helix domain-containing protein n=1 Tax=Desulfuromonas acetoxidans TaxID=891 RepID=UPI00292FAD9F|nr:helix-turn-helix transcriptional regulator [Desulfuromonas acetoxidans]